MNGFSTFIHCCTPENTFGRHIAGDKTAKMAPTWKESSVIMPRNPEIRRKQALQKWQNPYFSKKQQEFE